MIVLVAMLTLADPPSELVELFAMYRVATSEGNKPGIGYLNLDLSVPRGHGERGGHPSSPVKETIKKTLLKQAVFIPRLNVLVSR